MLGKDIFIFIGIASWIITIIAIFLMGFTLGSLSTAEIVQYGFVEFTLIIDLILLIIFFFLILAAWRGS